MFESGLRISFFQLWQTGIFAIDQARGQKRAIHDFPGGPLSVRGHPFGGNDLGRQATLGAAQRARAINARFQGQFRTVSGCHGRTSSAAMGLPKTFESMLLFCTVRVKQGGAQARRKRDERSRKRGLDRAQIMIISSRSRLTVLGYSLGDREMP
jgi:hypothetical protein